MNRFVIESILVIVITTLVSIAGTYTTALSLTAMIPMAVLVIALNAVLTFTNLFHNH